MRERSLVLQTGLRSGYSVAEDSAKAGTGVTTIIVSYFFYPSREVGAKRMTALADYLRANGEHVTVVSAFTGVETFTQDDLRWKQLRDYVLVNVPDSPSRVIAFLIRAKRYLRRLLFGTPQEYLPGSQAPSRSVEGFWVSGWLLLHRLVFNILHVIDDKKSWALRAARRALRATRTGHTPVIIVSGPPPSTVLGTILAARKSAIPVIVDLRDPIWLQHQLGARALIARWLERYVVRRADWIVTTSPTLRRQLQQTYPERSARISCILNGFDNDPLPKRRDTGNRLVVVYAGALYLNRNPFPFLEVLERMLARPEVDASRVEVVLNRNPFPFLEVLERMLARPEVDASRVEVVFAGECQAYQGVELREWLNSRRFGRTVTILPNLDQRDLSNLYERATLLLNFAEGQPMQIPAKTFELLALGRELLILCEPDSDTAALVKGVSGVSCACSSDAAGLQVLLLDLYRRHVTEGTLRAPSQDEIAKFSRVVQNERFIALIENARRSACDLQ